MSVRIGPRNAEVLAPVEVWDGVIAWLEGVVVSVRTGPRSAEVLAPVEVWDGVIAWLEGVAS